MSEKGKEYYYFFFVREKNGHVYPKSFDLKKFDFCFSSVILFQSYHHYWRKKLDSSIQQYSRVEFYIDRDVYLIMSNIIRNPMKGKNVG